MKKTNKEIPKMIDDPGQYYIDHPRGLRQHEVNEQTKIYNDTSLLIHQLALFNKRDSGIYKINAIDFVGERFECAGERISKWVSFNDGILFNFIENSEFEKYYEFYVNARQKPRSKETILDWLKLPRSRMLKIEEERNIDAFKKNNKRI